jgi:hypothetical protein
MIFWLDRYLAAVKEISGRGTQLLARNARLLVIGDLESGGCQNGVGYGITAR